MAKVLSQNRVPASGQSSRDGDHDGRVISVIEDLNFNALLSPLRFIWGPKNAALDLVG
jgi:hypothetical protein